MSIGGYVAASLDRSIYRIGRDVVMARPLRRYQDRPRMEEGESGVICDYRSFFGQYGPEPRILVTLTDGRSRWMDGADVNFADEGIS